MRCPECTNGLIQLFTSVAKCDKCDGTGKLGFLSAAEPVNIGQSSTRMASGLAPYRTPSRPGKYSFLDEGRFRFNPLVKLGVPGRNEDDSSYDSSCATVAEIKAVTGFMIFTTPKTAERLGLGMHYSSPGLTDRDVIFVPEGAHEPLDPSQVYRIVHRTREKLPPYPYQPFDPRIEISYKIERLRELYESTMTWDRNSCCPSPTVVNEAKRILDGIPHHRRLQVLHQAFGVARKDFQSCELPSIKAKFFQDLLADVLTLPSPREGIRKAFTTAQWRGREADLETEFSPDAWRDFLSRIEMFSSVPPGYTAEKLGQHADEMGWLRFFEKEGVRYIRLAYEDR